VTLPRGFKTHAEKEAIRWRHELGAGPTASVDLHALVGRLGIAILSAAELVERARLVELEHVQAFAFSAATFQIGDRTIIVTNPLHSVGRLTSDTAHELAHVLLDHSLSEIQDIAGVPFRTCSPDQEEQATAFGGTLLLPRPLLLAAAHRGDSTEAIADTHQVTVEMARYRYNTTGVAKQARRRSA